jgi:hypothetical protein
MRPGALQPNQVFFLSLIAGMAHSTLKSRAATRNGVAFGYQLKVRNGHTWPWDPVRSSSDPAADVADYARDPMRMDHWAGFATTKGGQARRDRTWMTEPGIFETSTIPF